MFLNNILSTSLEVFSHLSLISGAGCDKAGKIKENDPLFLETEDS